MAIIKCKMCGGDMELSADKTQGVCSTCGAAMSFSKVEVLRKPAVKGNSPDIGALMRRVELFLEDGDFQRADDFCEQVLNIDPENAMAYTYKLMAQLQVKQMEALKNCPEPFDTNNHYQKAIRFGNNELKEALTGYVAHIKLRNEQNRVESIYQQAQNAMASGLPQNLIKAEQLFASIPDYKDAAVLAKECHKKAEVARNDKLLSYAADLMAENTIEKYREALQILEKISGWKDADAKINRCKQAIRELAMHKEQSRRKTVKLIKRITSIFITAVALIFIAIGLTIASVILAKTVIIPNAKYSEAMTLKNAGEMTQAISIFNELGDFKDSREQCSNLWNEIAVRDTIDTGWGHTVALQSYGTVKAVGYNKYNQCDVSNWTDIIAISAGDYHTAGLRSNGTVVAVGDSKYNQCAVGHWTDIISINAGGSHTVGLKADSTVVASGWNEYGQCNVSKWTDIVAISAGKLHTVGLKADGTVIATGMNGDGQCDVNGWKDIVAIRAGAYHTVGLKADGTVVSVGDNSEEQGNISGWTNIVAISAGDYHTVGLKADGTVVAVGKNNCFQCNVTKWTDIVAISAGTLHTVGLKADGTMVAVGYREYNRCDVSDWTNIAIPDKKNP